MAERCPSCTSNAPHLHPAVQHGGEVEMCTDEFHLRPTPQNTGAHIALVRATRALYGIGSATESEAKDVG